MSALTLVPDVPAEPGATGPELSVVDAPTPPRGWLARSGAVLRAHRDRGAATAEYAVTIIAAVGLAGLLVTILASSDVRSMLLKIVKGALTI